MSCGEESCFGGWGTEVTFPLHHPEFIKRETDADWIASVVVRGRMPAKLGQVRSRLNKTSARPSVFSTARPQKARYRQRESVHDI